MPAPRGHSGVHAQVCTSTYLPSDYTATSSVHQRPNKKMKARQKLKVWHMTELSNRQEWERAKQSNLSCFPGHQLDSLKGLHHTQFVQCSWWNLTVAHGHRIWDNLMFGCSRNYLITPTSILGEVELRAASPINAPGQVSLPPGNLGHLAILWVTFHLAMRTLSFQRLLPDVTQRGNAGMRIQTQVYGVPDSVFFSSYHIA